MRMHLALVLSLALSICAASPVTFAQSEEGTDTGDAAATAVPEAEVFTSQHSLAVGGRTVDYTATAGTMLMKDDEGKARALFGYTAYVEKGADPATRPILFAYVPT